MFEKMTSLSESGKAAVKSGNRRIGIEAGGSAAAD